MTAQAILDQARERIQPHMKKWKPLLGLGNWRIEVDVYDHLDRADGTYEALMRVDVEWPYRQATIMVDACRLSDIEDEAEVERHVLHELTHCAVAELQECKESHHLERVVTDLTEAFQAVAGMGGKTDD